MNLSQPKFGYCMTTQILNVALYKIMKVGYSSGPIFEKIMKRYPIFCVQIINYQIDQKLKQNILLV